MKIAVSGKGGVGKTTFAAFLIRALADEGKKVLAIDADPDANLAQALGVKNSGEIVPISQMKELIEERTGAKAGTMGQFFKLNPKVDDLQGRNLYITGQRTSYAMAYVFHIMIKRIRPKSFLLGPQTTMLPDLLMDINSRDVLFAIFRHPYAKQTLRIARRFSDQGARIILLTDSEFSPLADLAHIQIVVASEGFSIFQSCTAVTAVLETLNIAALRFCDKTIYNRLENAEKLFRDFELFCSGKSFDTAGMKYLEAFREKDKL